MRSKSISFAIILTLFAIFVIGCKAVQPPQPNRHVNVIVIKKSEVNISSDTITFKK